MENTEKGNEQNNTKALNENIPEHLLQMLKTSDIYCKKLREISNDLSEKLETVQPSQSKELITRRTDAVLLLIELEAYIQEINRAYKNPEYDAWHKNNRWQWLSDATLRVEKFIYGDDAKNIEFIDFNTGLPLEDTGEDEFDIVKILAKKISGHENEINKLMKKLEILLPKLQELSNTYSRYDVVVDIKAIAARSLEHRFALLKSGWEYLKNNYNYVGKDEETKKRRLNLVSKYLTYTEKLLTQAQWILDKNTN